MYKSIVYFLAISLSVFILSYAQVHFQANTLIILICFFLFLLIYVASQTLLNTGSFQNTITYRPQKNLNGTLDWLLFLRFVAALVVFIMHSGIVLGRDFTFSGNWWGFLTYSPAWWAMTLFFSLSGFLMAKSFALGKYQPNFAGFKEYLQNRVVRIFPLALTAALFIVIWQSPEFINDFNFWTRLFTATFDGSGPEGVGAFWSISTELQYYFLVPGLVIIFVFLKNYIKPKYLIFTIALSFVLFALASRNVEWNHHGGTLAAWSPFVYEPLYSNIDAFGLGFCAGFASIRPQKWLITISKFLWLPILVFSYILYSANIHPLMGLGVPGNEYQFAVVWPTVNAILLSSVVFFADIASRNTFYKPGKTFRVSVWVLRWAGGLTFAIYLVHSSVLISVEKAFPNFSEFHRLFISIVLVLLLSIFLHIFVEKTSNRWRAQKISNIN